MACFFPFLKDSSWCQASLLNFLTPRTTFSSGGGENMTTNNGKRHRQRFEWESSGKSSDLVCGWRRLAAMTARTAKHPRDVIVRAVGIYWAVIWFLGRKNRQFGDHVSEARKTQDKCVGTVLKPHFRHESLNDKHTAVRSFFIKKTRTSGLFVHVSCISRAIKHRKTWIDSFMDIYIGKRILLLRLCEFLGWKCIEISIWSSVSLFMKKKRVWNETQSFASIENFLQFSIRMQNFTAPSSNQHHPGRR